MAALRRRCRRLRRPASLPQHRPPPPLFAAITHKHTHTHTHTHAHTYSDLPERFLDVSDARPVPDHQEVWGDPSRDQSLVVEAVERAADVADADAGAFFFGDLAAAAEAAGAHLERCEELGACVHHGDENAGGGGLGADRLRHRRPYVLGPKG